MRYNFRRYRIHIFSNVFLIRNQYAAKILKNYAIRVGEKRPNFIEYFKVSLENLTQVVLPLHQRRKFQQKLTETF